MSNVRLARLASPNRRDFFRLDVHETDCLFTVTSIAGQPPEGEAATPRTYEVLDLGGGGIAFRSRRDDWSIRDGIVATVQFRVGDREYEFSCQPVRKVDAMEVFDYGARWVDVPPPQIDDLVYTLYQMELARGASRPAPRGAPAGRVSVGRPATGARGGGHGTGHARSRADRPAAADSVDGRATSRQGLRRPALWASAGFTLGLGLLLLPNAPYRDPLAAALWIASIILCAML